MFPSENCLECFSLLQNKSTTFFWSYQEREVQSIVAFWNKNHVWCMLDYWHLENLQGSDNLQLKKIKLY